MDGDRRLWVAHPTEGFKLGRIVDIGADTLTVEPLDSPGTGITVPYDRVFPTDERDLKRDVDDNCALVFLNEATLLHNVRVRYARDVIYTYVANILIAVNPYKDLGALYTSAKIASYKGKSIGQVEPHVFSITDKAYREMKLAKAASAGTGININQSVIVSGESGAGKTETTKHILKYLTECYGQHAGPVEQRVVESNPLLEAFGNAKTTRNNNSSRFGKFVEVHFDSKLGVAGGQVSHYLLEKSRVVSQQPGERNYHIFYRLCAGAPEQLHTALQLASPDQFHMLRRGCTQYFCSTKTQQLVSAKRKSAQYIKEGCLTDVQLDDVADFKRTDEAMEKMGIDAEERGHIYSVVAGILHLGNVQFEEQKDGKEGGCRVQPDAQAAVRTASGLLHIAQQDLEFALTTRVTQAAKGGAMGTVIRKALSVGEAASARDALAKHIYSRLFDYIVDRVNRALPLRDSVSYIGILDIAGFEYFQSNSFEQLCINYCNEKLQNFFNERILKEEQILYEREGVPVERITFVDNLDCIELFENKGIGIFDLLDEENRLPRSAFDHFTNEVHSKNKAHFRLAVPRKSKLKAHRDMRDDQGFLVKHFAGAVCYSTQLFVEKNNDALHASLEVIVHDSKHPLLQKIFADDANSKKSSGTGKLNFISVGSKFRSQLDILMTKLKSTGTHFIRCVKPNVKMVSGLFEGANVLMQLQCSGMPSVLELMHKGYPSRTRFDDMYNRYAKLLPAKLAQLEPRIFCKMLFKALGMRDTDFVFGQTKVFFKSGKFSEFDQLVRTDPEGLGSTISQLTRWLIRYRWRFAQYGVWEVIKLRNKIAYRRAAIVKMQKTVRKFVAVRKYRHRYMALRAIRKLTGELEKMKQLAMQLKNNDKEVKAVETIRAQLDESANKLRNLNERVTRDQAAAMHSTASERVQATFVTLKKKLEDQKIREEEERVKRIQEELERERQRKLEEERKRREEEDDRKRRAELEEARKREEEERRRIEAEDRKLAEALQAQLIREREAEAERAKLIEQERVDRELALRLSHEDANQVEEIVTVAAPRAAVHASKGSKSGKHDLSSWTYAQLRDAINTSVDLDMIAACRDEFHRRLKGYHDWKTKQKQKKQIIAPLLGQTAAPPAASSGAKPTKAPPTSPTSATPTKVRGDVDLDEAMQTPPSLLENAAAREKHDHLLALKSGGKSSPTKRAGLAGTNPQRYFRVPLLDHEEASSALGKNGWWLAHFDGCYIARQCAFTGSIDNETVSDARLMVAGTDDLSMCELGLEETGLTQRKGAEITEAEFDSVWDRLGGKKYLQDRRTQVASKYLRTKLGLN